MTARLYEGSHEIRLAQYAAAWHRGCPRPRRDGNHPGPLPSERGPSGARSAGGRLQAVRRARRRAVSIWTNSLRPAATASSSPPTRRCPLVTRPTTRRVLLRARPVHRSNGDLARGIERAEPHRSHGHRPSRSASRHSPFAARGRPMPSASVTAKSPASMWNPLFPNRSPIRRPDHARDQCACICPRGWLRTCADSLELLRS